MWQNWEYKTSAEAYTEHFKRFLNPVEYPDHIFRGVMGAADNQVITITNPTTDINLGWVDFTPTRWMNFVAHYVHRDSMLYFMSRLPTLNAGQQLGYTTPVVAPHSLGNCLMGFTARKRGKKKAELSIVSRTTIWAPTGALDLYLGSLLACWWSERIKEPVTLRWYCHQTQITTWKSLPFFINLAYQEVMAASPEGRDPKTITRDELHATPLMQAVVGDMPTKNRFLKQFRTVYNQARNIHLHIGGTYRLPLRQTNRMIAAEQRFLNGVPRSLFPPLPLDPFKEDSEFTLPPTIASNMRYMGEDDDDD